MATAPDRDSSLHGSEARIGSLAARARGVASQRLLAVYRSTGTRRGLTPLVLVLFTLAYFAATCELASLKPFSFDELTTFNMARLPSAADVWAIWFESTDALPPLTQLSMHFVGSALGFSHVTARLPSMVGFWLACLCIFVFLSRRSGTLLALLGMILPLTIPAGYSYAYEARGYGIVLGFSGAAMLCWDLVRDPRWRPVALVGLPICLAGAIATHLYAVLLIVPFALGELARTIERRRVDWWVWLGLAAIGLLLLPANPVVARIAGLREMAIRSHRVSLLELAELWPQFLSTAATYFGLLALFCVCLMRRPAADGLPVPMTRTVGASPADWVFVLGLLMLPAVGWLFANLVTGVLIFRYVIAALIGFSLAVPFICWPAATRRPEIALLMVGWVAVIAVETIIASRDAMRLTTLTTPQIAAGMGCFRLFRAWKRLPQDDLPIVVSDFYTFHQVHHYAPDALKRRLVFVVDHEFGRLIEPYMPYYAKVFGERMERLESFIGSQRSFYLYDCGAGRQPLREQLLNSGASVSDAGLGESADIGLRVDLFRVSLPGR
jgi:hypothetical protein